MDLDRLTGRFGPLSRAGSALNLLIVSVVLIALAVSGEPTWFIVGLLWLVLLAAAIWAWSRRYTVFGTVGVQIGVAEAGPFAGCDLVVTHDGTTWTVDIEDERDAAARTLTFDNEEFALIRERWRIRWTA